MRPHLPTHASPGRFERDLRRLLHAAALVAFSPAIVLASHYTVSPSGGADFTTIQAAVNATVASPRDSLLIAPGTYPETVAFTSDVPSLIIVGTGGATATRLGTIQLPSPGPSPAPVWSFAGLTFDQFVNIEGRTGELAATDCVFAAGLSASYSAYSDEWRITDCEFRARTWLLGFWADMRLVRRLHFVHAPLYVSSGDGDMSMTDCTFEGPADTLVFAHPANESNNIGFVGCTFADGGFGVVSDHSCGSGIGFGSCRFSNIAHDAIRKVSDPPGAPPELRPCNPTGLTVGGSRFERCGTAIRWTPEVTATIRLDRDTVLDCAGDGLVLAPGNDPRFPAVSQGVVERSGGHGMVIVRGPGYLVADYELPVPVFASRFADNHGDGVTVIDTIATSNAFRTVFAGNTSEGNGGAGYRLEGVGWRVSGNEARANGGDGLVFRTHFPNSEVGADSIVSNTCAENGGDGIRLEHASAPGAYLQVVEHNLSAFNEGNGIATTAPHSGTVAFNDAWKNALAEYVSVASASDSNLTVNPQFCKHPADALTLRFGSKCGAGGVYGLIGAEPEACRNQAPSELAGGEDPAPTIAFSARPNPARGAVELAVPAGGADGRIEVLDAQGRRVWARDVRAGEHVRWTGETTAGRASPGLYLVRLTRPGETRFVRVVWME